MYILHSILVSSKLLVGKKIAVLHTKLSIYFSVLKGVLRICLTLLCLHVKIHNL